MIIGNEIKFNRINIIEWLEENKNQGFFDGYTEQYINFSNLSNDDLYWYFEYWYLPQVNE